MRHVPEVPPLFLADHPVLDFLNTIAAPQGEPMDVLGCDEDVLYWLEKTGLAPEEEPQVARGALLVEARSLREMLRPMLSRRKDGKRIDLTPLNAYMTQALSYPQLVTGSGGLRVERRRLAGSAQQILAPVAEAAAEFFAKADFNLVRACEGKGCILWFYDRTKSHRRRWCSMQLCGNRHKVEAFRERQRKS
jgi:predicted RNA-binding Zn ribbon-like protein